jgi:iron complex outermembrane receptor protein
MSIVAHTFRNSLFLSAVACAAVAGPAWAQTKAFNVAAQPAVGGVADFASQADVQILMSADTAKGRRTGAVVGSMSVEAGLSRLLAGSGLSVASRQNGVITLGVAGFQGAEAQGDEATAVEEIVVTAQKREERLVDVPMSIVALGGRELEKRNVNSLLDLTREAPGLTIQDQGVGQRRIFMRGVGNVFGTSALVGLYLDDASVSSIQDAEIDLRPYDLQRVEVLRGPQGTLYGEGSTAGTVRFITNSPNLDEIEGHAKYTGSFTEDGGMSNEFTGALSLPIVPGKFGIRLSGLLADTAGWIDQPAQNRKDINDQKVSDLRVIATVQPTEDLRFRFTGIRHRNDAGAADMVSNDQGTFAAVLGKTASPTSQDDYDFLNATVTWQLGGIQLLSSTTKLDVEKRNDAQSSTLLLSTPPFPLFEIFGNRLRTGEVFSQEFRASGATDRLTWVAGAYYRDSTSIIDIDLEAGFSPPGFIIQQRTEQGSEAWSAFGNVQYKLTDAWEIGAGLRYFRDRRTTADGVTNQSGDFESVSPRLVLKYSFDRSKNVYASVAKGFRSGGFNSLGQPDYGPEEAWTYELGAKANSDDGRTNAEIAVFHTDYKDVQVLNVDPMTLAQNLTNAGEAKIDGVEISLARNFESGLELGLNANYTHSEFTNVNPGSTHAVGDRLDFVPEYGVVAWAGYTFTLPGGLSAYGRVDYSLQGEANYRNRTIGDFFHSESDRIQLLNLSFETSVNDWRVELFGSNLLNDDGALDATAIEGYRSVHRPRTFGVSISRSF